MLLPLADLVRSFDRSLSLPNNEASVRRLVEEEEEEEELELAAFSARTSRAKGA